MIPFLKMHGLGNDFVVIDNRKSQWSALNWGKIADRHFGIGCDQVVVLEKSAQADVFMRIFNSDGGEVESCGNASRCVAWMLRSQKPGARSQKSVTIETLAGVIEAWVADDARVTIDMGEPRLKWREIPLKEKTDTLHLMITKGPLKDPAAVNIGNPHMVFFIPDVNAVPLHELGSDLETHPLFPTRVNVGVAQVESKDRLALRVWERGAGLTLACGTGACAALVAAHLRGLTGRKAEVRLPGGSLLIEWREDDNHVLMTGPAALSFKGEIDPQGYRA
jgi:diaminopimelate epimerase